MKIIKDKDTIAIVVVCYNRPDSAKRLLESLANACYPKEKQVPLIISVDCSGNEKMYNLAKNFEWLYGPKYAIIREERLGLKRHIYECGDLSAFFKGVIILEDDLFVAPDFYIYSTTAVESYYNEDKVAGIALYADTMYGYVGLPLYYWYDGSDGFMMQSTITWGECFSDKMWAKFRQWYNANIEVDPSDVIMPNAIKRYKRAWSKYFNIYLVKENLFFVHPHFSTSTNCGEAGVHGDGNNMIHSKMILGHKQYCFKSFDESVKYDIYGNPIGLGKYLHIPEEQLCVDFYGDKQNEQKRRYWLTPFRKPYQIIASYALTMEPMEANIVYNFVGDDLFLYDTSKVVEGKNIDKFTQRQLSFHIRNFNYKLMLRYLGQLIKEMARIKISRFLHIKK
ncbi:MAG: hypothetical protein ACOXZI_06360 [Candidatus Cryptobacteroides sp.]|jgi:hypothetical protein